MNMNNLCLLVWLLFGLHGGNCISLAAPSSPEQENRGELSPPQEASRFKPNGGTRKLDLGEPESLILNDLGEPESLILNDCGWHFYHERPLCDSGVVSVPFLASERSWNNIAESLATQGPSPAFRKIESEVRRKAGKWDQNRARTEARVELTKFLEKRREQGGRLPIDVSVNDKGGWDFVTLAELETGYMLGNTFSLQLVVGGKSEVRGSAAGQAALWRRSRGAERGERYFNLRGSVFASSNRIDSLPDVWSTRDGPCTRDLSDQQLSFEHFASSSSLLERAQ